MWKLVAKRTVWSAGVWALMIGLHPGASVQSKEALLKNPAPYQIVRAVDRLQSAIVAGRSDALSLHNSLIRQSRDPVLSQSAEAWKDPRNLRAVIILALNGADPAVLDKVSELEVVSETDRLIIEVARSYVSGNFESTVAGLDKLDLLSMPGSLGAVLAIAGGRVLQTSDPKKALKYYEIARLLWPGSLVEDVALRGSMSIELDQDTVDHAALVVRNYLQRMVTSATAKSAVGSILERVLALHKHGAPAKARALVWQIADIDSPLGKDMLKKLVRRAAEAQEYELSRVALRALEEVVKGSGSKDPSLQLIGLVAQLPATDAENLKRQLDGLDPGKLSAEDKELYRAMRAVAASLTRWPDERGEQTGVPRPSRYRPSNRLPRPLTPDHPDLDEDARNAMMLLDQVKQLREKL
jgi:chemotaxis protein MotC